MTWLQLSSLAVLAGFALVGALGDIRARIIPNRLCAAAVLTGLAFAFAIGGAAALMNSALHVAVALAGGIALFAAKAIGGGDAKFYAALAAWFPVSWGIYYLFCVSLAGIVLLIVWYAIGRYANRTSPDLGKESPFRKLPYGAAISAGGVGGYLVALIAHWPATQAG
jgi:prepilin peptidase CpaA